MNFPLRALVQRFHSVHLKWGILDIEFQNDQGRVRRAERLGNDKDTRWTAKAAISIPFYQRTTVTIDSAVVEGIMRVQILLQTANSHNVQ